MYLRKEIQGPENRKSKAGVGVHTKICLGELVFKSYLNDKTDLACLISSDKLFQSIGALTENAPQTQGCVVAHRSSRTAR